MHIYKLTDLTYRLTMEAFRTSLTDNCLTYDGAEISGCFSDTGTPEGFAIYRIYRHENQKNASVLCLEYAPGRDDVQGALLSDIAEKCKNEQVRDIYWSTSAAQTPVGFSLETFVKTYRVERPSRPQWREFRKTLQPLCNREIAHGYMAQSLSDCTEEQAGEIKNAYHDFRNSGYMDSVFRGDQGTLLNKESRVIIKDGHVAAYCLLTEEPENPKDCRLCYLGTAADTRRTPVGIFALCDTMDALDLSHYENMRFIVNGKNTDSGSLMEKQLSFIKPRTVIYTYVRHLNTDNPV